MVKLVFAVRVITKDLITDYFANFKSMVGGRIKSYENVIKGACEDATKELYEKYPHVKNVKLATTEMIKDGCEIIIYGEIDG